MVNETFLDLEIRIFPQRDGNYPVHVKLGDGSDFIGYLSGDILPWTSSNDPILDGQRLFGLLFADPDLSKAWYIARGAFAQRRIRLWLDTDIPNLHVLPWELLHDGQTFLAANTDIPFSRYLDVSFPWGGAIKERPIRVLAAIVSPIDLDQYNLPPLDVAVERTRLEDALRRLPVELRYLDAPATPENLETMLRVQRPHILHLVAHGMFSASHNQGALYLQDDSRCAYIFSDEKFSMIFDRLGQERPHLIYLAACEGAVRSTVDTFAGIAAKLVATGVPAVVAMQDQVTVTTVRNMTFTFYQELFRCGEVDRALNVARSLLLTGQVSTFAVPVLLMRLLSGKLFELPAQLAPLVQYPKLAQFQHDHSLIGRDADLDWLWQLDSDALLVGQPGSGKTFLLRKFALEGGGLFVDPDAASADIVMFLRTHQLQTVIVDESQTQRDLITDLIHIRAVMGLSFTIIATCWPGNQLPLMRMLVLSESQVHQLSLLTRDEIVEVIEATRLTGPNELIREIVDQAEGRPGLATTLAYLCLQGNIRQVVLGDVLSDMIVEVFEPLIGKHTRQILAAFAIGGDMGMSLESVAEVLDMPVLEVQQAAFAMAAGGVFYEVGFQQLSVRPPALRYVLVRDVFFNGALGLPHLYLELLEKSPDLAQSVNTLMGAKARGGLVSQELLTGLVEKVNSLSTWATYVQLGYEEATRVFRDYTEVAVLPVVARSGLSFAPDKALTLLLEKIVSDNGPLHSNPDHPLRIIQDWVFSGGEPGSGQSISRRKLLLAAIHSWLENGREAGVGIRALEFVLSPNCGWHTSDPGSGTSITIHRGLVSPNELYAIQELWPSVLALLHTTPIADWSPIQNIVRAWTYPGLFHPQVSPQVSEISQAFAVQLLHDILPLIEAHPGLCHWAKQISDDLPEVVEIPLDATFEVLYPQEHVNDAENWRIAERRQKQEVLALAQTLKQDNPEQVIQRLVWIESEAYLMENRFPRWTPVLCLMLAESTIQPQVWVELMLETDLPGDLISPFLSITVNRDLPGWQELITRSFEYSAVKGTAISLILTHSDPPESLLFRALVLLNGYTELVKVWCVRRQVSDDVLRRLLHHSEKAIVTATVVGVWNADPQGSVPESVRKDWEYALINDIAEDYWLSRIFEQRPELAYPWLQARINEGLPLFFTHAYEEIVKAAVGVFGSKQRRQLLCQLSGTEVLDEMILYLIGEDFDAFREFLNNDHYKHLHLVPLRRSPEGIWVEMAKLALDAGYTGAEIAEATHQHTGSLIEWESGPESKRWQMWMERFEQLFEHEDERIREIGQAGWKQAEKEYKRNLKRERDRAVYGWF